MIRMKRMLLTAVIAAGMCVSATSLLAQAQDNGGGGGRRGRGNFDPAQFQQRMMDRYREELEITKDDEWQAIEPLIQKVMDARMAASSGRFGRGGFGRRNRGGDTAQNDQQNRPRRFGAQPSAAEEALQKAVDDKASNDELKTAIAKYTADRKAKEADLEKAQDALRKVLTVRQEAIATLNGLL